MAKQQKQPPKIELKSAKAKADKPLSEFVIKEVMIQKGVDREEAIEILKNPTPQDKK